MFEDVAMIKFYFTNCKWFNVILKLANVQMFGIAAEFQTGGSGENAIFACIATAQPKSNPGGGLCFAAMEWRREIG